MSNVLSTMPCDHIQAKFRQNFWETSIQKFLSAKHLSDEKQLDCLPVVYY
jgi:hypothetical protein